MKKKACLLLVLVMMLSLLSGCYKMDTTISVGAGGGVRVSSTLMATKEMYAAAGGTGARDISQNIDMIKQYYGESEPGEVISVNLIDEHGNALAADAPTPEDGTMVGTTLEMRFDSLNDLKSSPMLASYFVTTPLMQDSDGYGLKVQEKRTLLGAVYTVSGKYSLYGDANYKGAYERNDQALKDNVSAASAKLTFAFPLGFSKSNADDKSLFGNRLTWTATADAPDKDVYFSYTTINPVILALSLAVIILLIVIILMARKNKKNDAEPDDYFVDEEGNVIPIFDAEEDDFAEEAEIVTEEADETEEIAEEIAEAEVEEEKSEE